MCRPPSSDRIRRRACGLRYPASGDPATARRFTRPSPPRRRPIVQRYPTGGGRRWFPGPSSAGRWPLHFPGRAPPVPSPWRFWARNCRLCWSSAGGDGVPPLAGNGAGSGRWSPLHHSHPAGDPTPITQVKVRTRAKPITSFSLSKPVPGFKTDYRFSGSRLTSLLVSG